MKYTYPVKFASDAKAAYIRDAVINSGALFLFYRTTITLVPEPCASGPWLTLEGDFLQCDGNNCQIFWSGSGREVYTASYRMDSFNGNTGTYHFFAYFTPDTTIACPPGWQGIIGSTSVRIKVAKTSKYTRYRTFEEVEDTCSWPVDCGVTVQAVPYYYQSGDVEETDYVNLTLQEAESLNDGSEKWDELSEGVAGDFPLNGTTNKYYYAYGTIETGGGENCKIGGVGDALSGSYVPSTWQDGHVATDIDTGERIEEVIDTADPLVEVKQGAEAWEESGIWVGNSIYQAAFSQGYWEGHVFDLDA